MYKERKINASKTKRSDILKRGIQKSMVVGVVFLLGLTTIVSSTNMALAENVTDSPTVPSTDESLPLPYEDLLKSTTSVDSEVESKKNSFFSKDFWSGKVGEIISLSYHAENKVDKVTIQLPDEAYIDEGNLSENLSVEKSEIGWNIYSKNVQAEFMIPVIFKEAGVFEASVDEAKTVVRILQTSDDNPVYEEAENTEKESDRTDSQEAQEIQETQEAVEDEVGVTEVHSFAEFQTAVRNNEISKISVQSDISAPNATVTQLIRNSSLMIEGNGHTINMRNNIITTNTAVINGTTGMLEFNNIHFDSEATDATSTNIRVMEGAPSVNRWTVRFGNITTTRNITRLAINDYGRIEMYGVNNINTRYENFILSDIELDSNTTYFGNVNLVDVSVLWYRYLSRTTDSARNQGFVIGDNSYVQLGQTQTVGTTYPAVYLNYSQLTVGENATFNVTMPGNAVRLQVNGARMDVRSGAQVNLTSRSRSGSVIAFSRSNTTISVEPHAEFYVIGNSTRPLIDMSSNDSGTAHVTYTGNQFILNQPQNFDIRNLVSGNSSIAVAIAANNSASNRFSIRNSDIDLWNVSSNPLGPSDSNFTEVEEFIVTGRGTQQTVSTTAEGLQSFNQNTIRRISGMSQIPSVIFDEEITDAHLNIKARVIVGYVPDNEGANEDGEVNYIPVYASEGQATGTIIDTFGIEHTGLVTDSDGYISYRSEDFNLAGEKIVAKDIRIGSRGSEESAEVIVTDVTPPKPAKIARQVYEDSNSISGSSEEVGVLVDYTINGQVAENVDGQKLTTTVNPDGSWDLPILADTISEGDELQIFLTDKVGNRNPVSEKELFDAIFPPATRTEVSGRSSIAPVDPLNPEIEVTPDNKPEIPENQGLLSIDFASQFHFGAQSISAIDKTYYAQTQRLLDENGEVIEGEERPNYVQISDRRSEADRFGWEISVTQNTQFANEAGDELSGAELRFMNQQLATAQGGSEPTIRMPEEVALVPEERHILLTASRETGTGTWIYRFGDQNTADNSVALNIPQGANPQADHYKTTLTWELSMVPENE